MLIILPLTRQLFTISPGPPVPWASTTNQLKFTWGPRNSHLFSLDAMMFRKALGRGNGTPVRSSHGPSAPSGLESDGLLPLEGMKTCASFRMPHLRRWLKVMHGDTPKRPKMSGHRQQFRHRGTPTHGQAHRSQIPNFGGGY